MSISDLNLGRIKSSFKYILTSNFIIIILYFVLSIIFTYPVAFSRNEVPGYADCHYYLWSLWWFKTSLFNLSNPFYTNYMYYPEGVHMWFVDNAPLNGLFSIPLQILFGLAASYKIIWILTFIFSGYAMFLLVRYITRNPYAAFISGLVFMFCPYRFAHALGHMNLISTIWIPLYILYFLKTINEPKRVNILILSVMFLFNMLSSYYYVVFLLAFSILYLLYFYLTDRELLNANTAKRITLSLIISGIFSMPLIYPMFRELLSAKIRYMYSEGFVVYSADLLGFILPSIFHPLFKNYVAGIYTNFTGNDAEFTVFVGYTVLILSILSILKLKSNYVSFWALCSIIFFVLSLGPLLHINGLFNFYVENYSVYLPLPYSILMRIPIFSLARVPSRWDIMLILSLSVLVGYMIDYVSRISVYSEMRKKFIYILISGLILFEFLSIPFPMISADVPSFYHKIAADKEDYVILEIPSLHGNLIYPNHLYYQVVHGKRLIGGYVGRANVIPYPSIIEELWMGDQPSTSTNVTIDHNETTLLLNLYNIKYIVLHTNLLNPEQIQAKTKQLAQIDSTPDYYEDESMIVYNVPQVDPNSCLNSTIFADGWSIRENWDGIPTQWITDAAGLFWISNENRTAHITLRAISFHRPRTLEVYSGDRLTASVTVPCEYFINITAPLYLTKGKNAIRLHVPEGCERPVDIKELNNPDPRCLSIAVQNVTAT